MKARSISHQFSFVTFSNLPTKRAAPAPSRCRYFMRRRPPPATRCEEGFFLPASRHNARKRPRPCARWSTASPSTAAIPSSWPRSCSTTTPRRASWRRRCSTPKRAPRPAEGRHRRFGRDRTHGRRLGPRHAMDRAHPQGRLGEFARAVARPRDRCQERQRPG